MSFEDAKELLTRSKDGLGGKTKLLSSAHLLRSFEPAMHNTFDLPAVYGYQFSDGCLVPQTQVTTERPINPPDKHADVVIEPAEVGRLQNQWRVRIPVMR